MSTTTTETFTYDRQGRETQRVMVRTGSALYGLGSVGLPMSFGEGESLELVPIPSGTMQLERVITTTYRSGGYAKTVTSRFGPWIQTPQGQQTVAEAREYFDTAAKVSDFIGLALSGSFLLDTTISTQFTGEDRADNVSAWEANAPSAAEEDGDPLNGWKVENSTDSVFVTGTGSNPFGAFTFTAPNAGDLSSGELAKVTAVANATPTPQRRIVVNLPLGDDDRIVRVAGDPVTYRVVKGRAENQAREFGILYARFLIGVRYGLSMQMVPRYGPRVPLEPFTVEVAGTMPSFLANGLSWTLSSDGMVLSCDALYDGAIGGPSYSFPVADGVSVPTSKPTPTTTEPGAFIGTIDDVGETPQTALNAAFPSAVSGDGVQDLATLETWSYNGTSWVNVGQDPAPVVSVTAVLPHTTQTDGVMVRSRHRVTVQSFDYALTVGVQTVTVTSRHRVTCQSIVPVAVPSAAVAVAGVAPTVTTS